MEELGSHLARLRQECDELKRAHERDMAYCKKLGEELVDQLVAKCDAAEKQRDLLKAEGDKKDELIKQLLAEKDA